MSDYGVTLNGVNVNKSDTIQSEIHAALSTGWNVNTRNNPQSFLNVLVTDFADKLAELWQFGSGIYYSMYPSSAEGTNLDNAVQYSGVTRRLAEKSYYAIHCKGVDGTVLSSGTRIASISNPVNYFSIVTSSTIPREKFNAVAIRVQSVSDNVLYTVVINGISYSTTSGASATELSILHALEAAITDVYNFSITVDEDNALLLIEAADVDSVNSLSLSSNLTTEYVVTIVQFASEAAGDVDQPDGTITQIVTAVTGLQEVTNLGGYLPGREKETDTELRQSYIKKIFHLGSRMADSIASKLLNDVSNVDSVTVFENDTDYTTLTYICEGSESGHYCFESDGLYYAFEMPNGLVAGDKLVFSTETKSLTFGDIEITITITKDTPGYPDITEEIVSDIWPHSIECVIDGGDEAAIAKKILESKAAGINTFGSTLVYTPDSLGNMVPIRFTRPDDVFMWFNCEITASTSEAMPSNYVELIQDIIWQKMDEIDAGGFVSPQKWLQDIFTQVSGIAYIEITMAAEMTDSVSPIVYNISSELAAGTYYLRYCKNYYSFTLSSALSGEHTLTFYPSGDASEMMLDGTTSVELIVSDYEPAGIDKRAEFMAGYTLKNYQTTTRQRPRIKDSTTIGVTIVG